MNNEYLSEFIKYLQAQKRYSKNTINSYTRDLTMFFNYLEKENIKEVTLLSLQSYLSYLFVNNISKSSVSRKLSSIKSYARYLHKYKSLEVDFILNTTLPKKTKTLPNYLHNSELNKILNFKFESWLDIRNCLIINLLYSSGLRLSELTSLKVNDFNQENNVIKIKGKGNKERLVIFSARSKHLLELYLKTRKFDSKYLLINKNGTKLTNRGVELILKNISKKYLGHTNLHPHLLRHTFATNLLNNGMDIRSLQELLGHKSLNATQIYTHIAKNELKNIYNEYHPRNDD